MFLQWLWNHWLISNVFRSQESGGIPVGNEMLVRLYWMPWIGFWRARPEKKKKLEVCGVEQRPESDLMERPILCFILKLTVVYFLYTCSFSVSYCTDSVTLAWRNILLFSARRTRAFLIFFVLFYLFFCVRFCLTDWVGVPALWNASLNYNYWIWETQL